MAIIIYRDKNKDRKNSWIRLILRRNKQNKNNLIVMIGPTGCQPKGSKVLMANGEWKSIENIKKGDFILSPQKNGKYKYSKVINTSKWFCNKNYDVITKNKGNKKLYSCSYNHIIPIYRNFNKRKTINGKRKYIKKWWDFSEYEAEKFANMSSKVKSHQNIGFTSPAISEFKGRKDCEIEPYTLGVFLGDGMFRSNQPNERKRRDIIITSADFKIMEEISKHYPIMNIYNDKRSKVKGYAFSINSELSKLLTKYNLEGKKSGTKFIPKEALLSNLDYRKKLLAGLIDTDGYYRNGGYSITTKSKKLSEDILFLVHTLGGRGNIKKVKKGIKKLNFIGEYYLVSFYLGDLNFPLKLQRKIKDTNCVYINSNRIAIDLKKSKASEVYGFEIDSESKWYITDNWMVTHNSGKTWTTMSICESIAKENKTDFNVDNIVFTLKELMALINSDNLKKGSCIIFDEPQVSISNREFMSEANKVFNYLLTTFRHRNLNLFFCTPYEDLLDKASRKLFHAKFEIVSINYKRQTVRVKPKTTEYNSYMQKFYEKYLRVCYKPEYSTKYVTKKLMYWDVEKPSKDLINDYEEKKLAFTTNLNRRIQNRLEKYDMKDMGVDDFTPRQISIYDAWHVKGIRKLKDIAKYFEEKEGKKIDMGSFSRSMTSMTKKYPLWKEKPLEK